MKKSTAAILAFVIMLALVGCGGQQEAPTAPSSGENMPPQTALNRTVEIPGGALSFMINDSWEVESEAAGSEQGVIRPMVGHEDIKLTYGTTGSSDIDGSLLVTEFYQTAVNQLKTLEPNETNYTELAIDNSLNEYYVVSYSYEFDQDTFGQCKSYNVFLVDSSGVSNVSFRVPLNLLDKWEPVAIEFIKSVRALPTANTRSQLNGNEAATPAPSSTPNPASTPAPKNYTDGVYKVGTDLPAGEYQFIAMGNGYVCAYPDTTKSVILENENFEGRYYLTLEDGQLLEADRVIFSNTADIASVMDNSPSAGMHRVGIDIPTGEYKLTATGRGYYCVYDSSAVSHEIVNNNNFDNIDYITVVEGQYLLLARCTGELT